MRERFGFEICWQSRSNWFLNLFGHSVITKVITIAMSRHVSVWLCRNSADVLAAGRSSSNHGILDAQIDLPRFHVYRLNLTSMTLVTIFSSCRPNMAPCENSVSSCGLSVDYRSVMLSVLC